MSFVSRNVGFNLVVLISLVITIYSL